MNAPYRKEKFVALAVGKDGRQRTFLVEVSGPPAATFSSAAEEAARRLKPGEFLARISLSGYQ